VVAIEQNPLQIADAHCPPPGQSCATAQSLPLLVPPAHFFAIEHAPSSSIVPIWIVDRNNPDPIPPAPENRVRVGLLHNPMCSGVAVHAVPHSPPEPQNASAVHGCPRFGPAVQISNFSRQATSPLPAGGAGSARTHAVVSSGLAQADPGQSLSSSQ
jgi:hypothetical protein